MESNESSDSHGNCSLRTAARNFANRLKKTNFSFTNECEAFEYFSYQSSSTGPKRCSLSPRCSYSQYSFVMVEPPLTTSKLRKKQPSDLHILFMCDFGIVYSFDRKYDTEWVCLFSTCVNLSAFACQNLFAMRMQCTDKYILIILTEVNTLIIQRRVTREKHSQGRTMKCVQICIHVEDRFSWWNSVEPSEKPTVG